MLDKAKYIAISLYSIQKFVNTSNAAYFLELFILYIFILSSGVFFILKLTCLSVESNVTLSPPFKKVEYLPKRTLMIQSVQFFIPDLMKGFWRELDSSEHALSPPASPAFDGTKSVMNGYKLKEHKIALFSDQLKLTVF